MRLLLTIKKNRASSDFENIYPLASSNFNDINNKFNSKNIADLVDKLWRSIKLHLLSSMENLPYYWKIETISDILKLKLI